MRAVDTNVLVRLVARDNSPQLAAARSFVAGGVWASQLVLVETAWVLQQTYGFDDAQLAEALEMLLDNERLTVQEADVAIAALSLFKKRPALGFADCLILETARKAGHLPLGTFDRELGKADGARRL
ncbi:MAG TPA: type II toxin-antitoxin system VapC family toxin [Polyangia bacterium]|nr:type II toxin-antitoxin system VapC family toxin [Polyangia bacterium]